MARPTFAVPLVLLAIAALAQGPTPADRRIAVRIDGGRRVDVFRAVPLFRGLGTDVLLSGRDVERATRLEVPAGLSAPETSLRRQPGGLEIPIRVDASARLGTLELRLRFPIELAGPEVYTAVVLRNGRVAAVEPRRVPPGKKVVLTFTGEDIGNADVLSTAAYSGARVLPGGGDTRCQVELTFTRPGRFEVPLYDRAGIPKPAATLDAPGGYARDAGAWVEVTP